MSSKSFALAFTHIRTISNHWCTRSRFGAKFKGCIFGCGGETDAIRHSCACPTFWESFFRTACFVPFLITPEKVLVLSEDGNPISDSHAHMIFICLHTCFLCYHACRHGHNFCDRLIQHHLSHFLRQHSRVSTLYLNLKGT